jgi:aminoglycoside 2'-N-acetyltransferase I
MTESLHIEITPRASLTQTLHGDIIALCTRAYEEEFGDILALFDDPTHVVAYLGGELVSHALWIPRTLTYNGAPLLCAYVEAVATEPRHQGRGYASAVLRALAAAITAYDIGALSPSDPAFYARLGWESWRGPLAAATDAGITPTPGEDVMILRLPKTPPLDLKGTLVAPWRTGDIW